MAPAFFYPIARLPKIAGTVSFLRIDIDSRGDVYLKLLMGDIIHRTGYYIGQVNE